MPSRPIPEEIISMILAYLMDSPAKQTHDPTKTTSKRVAIVQYACVSSIWRAEVERLLYEELSLSSPLEIVLCFRIIAYGRRGVGKYVKRIHISLQGYDTAYPSRRTQRITPLPFQVVAGAGDDGRLLMAFARLVRDTFMSMKQLTSYHLIIEPFAFNRGNFRRTALENKFARPFLPLDTPFKLQDFYCSGLPMNAPLVRFLRDQKSIIQLDAPELHTKYRLGSPVLPSLQMVCGTDSLLRRIVPGRPIHSVRCTKSVPDGEFLALLQRLRESTTPLKQLVMPLIFLSAARALLPILADTIPSLERLVMSDHAPSFSPRTEATNPYNWYKDDAFLHSLSKMNALKELTVYAKPFTLAFHPSPSTFTGTIAGTEDAELPDAEDDFDEDDLDDLNTAIDLALVAPVDGDFTLIGGEMAGPVNGGVAPNFPAPTNNAPPNQPPLHPPPGNELNIAQLFAAAWADNDGTGNFDGMPPLEPIAPAAAPNPPPNHNNLAPPPHTQPVPTAPTHAPGVPQNANTNINVNGGNGVNITVNLAQGNAALGGQLAGALMQQMQAVAAQLFTQLLPIAGSSQPPHDDEVDEDMILDEDPPMGPIPNDPPDFADAGPFWQGGAIPGAGAGPQPANGLAGQVQIDAIFQFNPPPGPNQNAAEGNAPFGQGWPFGPIFGQAGPNFPAPPPAPIPAPLDAQLGAEPAAAPAPVFLPLPAAGPNPAAALPPIPPNGPAMGLPPLLAGLPLLPPMPGQAQVIFVNHIPPAVAGPPHPPNNNQVAGAAGGAPAVPAAGILGPQPHPLFLPAPQGPNLRQHQDETRKRVNAFQREQAAEERGVLDLWLAYCPSLEQVTFEMDFGRHVVWKRHGLVWKPTYTPSSLMPRKKRATSQPAHSATA